MAVQRELDKGKTVCNPGNASFQIMLAYLSFSSHHPCELMYKLAVVLHLISLSVSSAQEISTLGVEGRRAFVKRD